MGPAFAIGALIWAAIIGYATAQSGWQEVQHKALSILGALQGDEPVEAAAAAGAGAGAAGVVATPGIHPPAPSGKAAAYMVRAKARWPLLVNWGCFSCRHIAGSTTWSQHAWANAVDYHPPTKAYGDSVHAWIMANAASLSVAHVLWQVPDHYDHIHVDFDPQGTGTPPCAAKAGGPPGAGGAQAQQASGSNVTSIRRKVGAAK